MTNLQEHVKILRKQAESLNTTALVLSRNATSHLERAALARRTADQIEALLDGAQPAQSAQPTTTGVPTREVQHVDTDEPEAEGIPPHVWLYRNMLTDLQLVAPIGRDETNGQYAVAVDQLTDEQRAIPHVKAQLDRAHADILDGINETLRKTPLADAQIQAWRDERDEGDLMSRAYQTLHKANA